MRAKLFVAALMMFVSPAVAWETATPERHTDWCFWDSTNNRLADQPMDRGICAALLTGGLAASYFSGNPAILNMVLYQRQNEWSRQAVPLACSHLPQNEAMAISLIAACHCHNDRDIRDIKNGAPQVLARLRAIGNCP